MTVPFSQASLADTLNNRPAADPAKTGRFFFATDEAVLYRDNGTTWEVTGRANPTVDVNDDHPQIINLSGEQANYDVPINLSAYVPPGKRFALLYVQVASEAGHFLQFANSTAVTTTSEINLAEQMIIAPITADRTTTYSVNIAPNMIAYARVRYFGAF